MVRTEIQKRISTSRDGRELDAIQLVTDSHSHLDEIWEKYDADASGMIDRQELCKYDPQYCGFLLDILVPSQRSYCSIFDWTRPQREWIE